MKAVMPPPSIAISFVSQPSSSSSLCLFAPMTSGLSRPCPFSSSSFYNNTLKGYTSKRQDAWSKNHPERRGSQEQPAEIHDTHSATLFSQRIYSTRLTLAHTYVSSYFYSLYIFLDPKETFSERNKWNKRLRSKRNKMSSRGISPE